MPTGYTADIENGKYETFEEYAVQCMRNFGACIMQRDDGMNEKPKLREAGAYYNMFIVNGSQFILTESEEGVETDRGKRYEIRGLYVSSKTKMLEIAKLLEGKCTTD